MSTRLLTAFLAFLLLGLAVACGGAGPSGSGVAARPAAPPPPSAPRPALVQDLKGSDVSTSLPGEERKVVRTVGMTAVVKEVGSALADIAHLAEGMGGFVVSSYIEGGEKNPTAAITFRVPAERTDEALGRVRSLAVRVTAESTNAQDVTEEYADLQARTKNLQAAEEQYLDILKKATTVEDILKVQRELTNVRGEIERIRGRIQYLEGTSATSLITVHLLSATSPGPLVEPGWDPLETAREAFRGLARGLQSVVNGVIRIAVFSPLWVPPVAVLAFLLVWAWRRIHR